MTKRLLPLSLAVSVLLLTGCPQPATEKTADNKQTQSETLTIKGSDTMGDLGKGWAEVYMKAHPEVSLQVTPAGSGVGIAALIDGTTQICQASRQMKDSEKQKLKEKRMVDAVETAVARDALAIYLNKENPVKALTVEQIGKIFRGEITNWKDVGGTPGNIVLYGRENSSGTYAYLKEHALGGKDFSDKYQALPGTGAVVNAVAKDKGGIGYGGIGFAQDIKTVNVSKDAKSMPIAPSKENVLNETYPISRYLYWYTAGPATGAVKGVLDFVLSPEGQKIVEDKGFYPLH
jgi:phosphate transport system substrate-binding protein